MAIVIEDLKKINFQVDRASIERAIKGVGSTTDNRYFLKNGTATTIHQGKKYMQKKRCCTLEKNKVARGAVDHLVESKKIGNSWKLM